MERCFVANLEEIFDRILGIDKIEQQAEEIFMDERMICESCGGRGTHLRCGYDVCPTDRGDERRYHEEWLCDHCDPQFPDRQLHSRGDA
jgi:hypothetical protein